MLKSTTCCASRGNGGNEGNGIHTKERSDGGAGADANGARPGGRRSRPSVKRREPAETSPRTTTGLFRRRPRRRRVKSAAALLPVHAAQALTYLRLTNCPIGLLINFNVPRL